MPDRIAEEELAHLERLFDGASEHFARGHFSPGDVAGRLAEAEVGVRRLVAEVRRLRRIEEAAKEDLRRARASCGSASDNVEARRYCDPYRLRNLTCPECPLGWVATIEEALEGEHGDG